MINKEFKSKTHEQRHEECSLKRFQTKEGKWNLQNKKTGEFISDIWFDNLGTWSSFSCIVDREHDIFGWDGLIFLEEPKPTKGAYPYSVKAKCYHYNSEGELLEVFEEITCGIWGFGYDENIIY